MRRILSKHTLLFINHGKTEVERRAALSLMTSPNITPVSMRENQMRVMVEKNVEADVPDWCAGTKTWKDAKADKILIELMLDPEEEETPTTDETTPTRRARKS